MWLVWEPESGYSVKAVSSLHYWAISLDQTNKQTEVFKEKHIFHHDGPCPLQWCQPQGNMIQRSVGKGPFVKWEAFWSRLYKICSLGFKKITFFSQFFCCSLDHLKCPDCCNGFNILVWWSLGSEWFFLEERCQPTDLWAAGTSLGWVLDLQPRCQAVTPP